MKWIIDDLETFNSPEEAARYIMQNAGSDEFDELIDYNYPKIEICGYEYYSSIVFQRVDPMSYRLSLAEWKETEAGEIARELVRMRNGETLPFYECQVTYLTEEESKND